MWSLFIIKLLSMVVVSKVVVTAVTYLFINCIQFFKVVATTKLKSILFLCNITQNKNNIIIINNNEGKFIYHVKFADFVYKS